MTSGMDKRGKALEGKYFHDKELQFKVASRRRKLLGLWAAEQMHKADEEALEYALEIVRLGVTDSSHGAVVNRVRDDIKAAGYDLSEDDIRKKMAELEAIAEEQVVAEFEEEQ